MPNHRTQRLLLCVLLSLVVHVGLAASFVSAIQPKSVPLEIVNPIQVSLVQDISDAIGTAASRSIESNLNQLSVSETQRNSIDLNQPVDSAFLKDDEVFDELELAAVVHVDANQSTEIAEIVQPSPPLPVIEEEVNNERSEAEVQPNSTEANDVSSNMGHMPEPRELESTESEIVESVAEPIPPEPVSEQLSHITETVKKPTGQMAHLNIDNEIENWIESFNEPVSDRQPAEVSILQVPTSSEFIADVSDADELAGIWSSETIESVSVNFEQLPLNESTPEEIAEPEIQVEAVGIVELPEPVSIPKSEIAQVVAPDVIDIELFDSEIYSTPGIEHKTRIDEQFANYAPSNSIEIAHSRIDEGIEYLTDSDFQPVSDNTPIETSIHLEQKSVDQFADFTDADELAGIWSTEAKEPATIEFERLPSREAASETTVESENQVASISELPNSVENLITEFSQVPPPEFIELAHFTEEVTANTSSQTAYFGINDDINLISEVDHQVKSNIAPVEISSVPLPASSELVASKSDADDLAGIWPTELIEPATIEFERSPSNEPKSEEIVEIQSLFASTTDLSEQIQPATQETEPKAQPVPTAPVSVVNQTAYSTDLDEEVSNAKTVDLNDSWLNNQAPSATGQLAYAPPKLEPKPIRKDISNSENTLSDDGFQLESRPTEYLPEANGAEQKADEQTTIQQASVPEATQENQPEVDDTRPSPDLLEVTESERTSIPNERQQVASIGSVQQSVKSNHQDTMNNVTQEASLGGISADVGPKYGVEGLPNQAPRYPYRSRANDEQGRVILRVIVDQRGRAKEVTVLESSGYSRLDKAARKAVKRWRFLPAQKNGQSIQGVVQVPINFVLNSS